MKKKYIVLTLAAAIAAIAGIFIYQRVQVEMHTDTDGHSVSIIGAADGPTAIFVAGKKDEKSAGTYTSITMDEAKEVFENDGSYIILDVRRADEFAEGHIPGAINIANEDIGLEEPTDLPDKQQMIYVYCRSGRRSKEAAAKLSGMGYTSIVECGGILDWKGDIVTE